MSDTGRDMNLIPDDVQANYRLIRLERDWSWVQLAEDFERQGNATREPDSSFLRLAMWARVEAVDAGEVPGPAEREGTTPTPPGRGRRGRRTAEAEPAPHRTEAPATEVTDAAAVPAGVGSGLPVAI